MISPENTNPHSSKYEGGLQVDEELQGVTQFHMRKIGVDSGKTSAIGEGWNMSVILRDTPQVGGQILWQGNDGSYGNSSQIVSIERKDDLSWIIKTETSTYELQSMDQMESVSESVDRVVPEGVSENRFHLKKIHLNDGAESVIESGWEQTVQLMMQPRVGESLFWSNQQQASGNTSAVKRITKTGKNCWVLETGTSTYELSHDATQESKTGSLDIEKILQNPKTPSDIRAAFEHSEFRPVKSVEIEGKTFYVSEVFGGSRDTALVYALDSNGALQLSIYYKSQSDGGWRLNAPTPYSHNPQDLSKGLRASNGMYRHYTKETKPHEKLVELLDSIRPNSSESNRTLYEKHRDIRDLNKNESNFARYKESIVAPENRADVLDVLKTGELNLFTDETRSHIRIMGGIIYGNEPLTVSELKNITFPADFIPDFSEKPKRVYFQSHSIFSKQTPDGRRAEDIRVEVFESEVIQGGKTLAIDWHMATSPKGDVWVERIISADAKINAFGTYDRLYDFGVFDLKPVDYDSQVPQIPAHLKQGLDGEYEQITDFLAELAPIKGYKEARPYAKQE